MIKRILFAISAAVLLVSCAGPSVEKGSKPQISLVADEVLENTLTFSVSIKDALAAAYMCLPATDAVPAAETVLQKGKPINATEPALITVYSLAYTTAYNIVVAAMDEDGNVAIEILAMTTGEQATNVVLAAHALTYNSFEFKITPTNADAVYYKMYSKGETATNEDIIATGVSVDADKESKITVKPEAGDYFIAALAKKGDVIVRAQDVEFYIKGVDILVPEVKRVEAKEYGTDILYDIYLQNSDVNVIKLDCYYHQGSTSPEGEYVYGRDEDYGKVVHSYSYISFLSSSRMFFTGGTVKVSVAAGGQYTLKVNMTREDGKVYDFTWTGAVQWK